jgi:hypothetical protein
MNKKTWFAVLAIAAILTYMTSCVDAPYDPLDGGTPTPLPTVSGTPYAAATITGIGIEFDWKVNGTNLDCIMKSPSAGWVAVGLNSAAAKDGNIFIGYVDGTGAHVRYDNMSSWPHAPNAVQNVTNISGSEAGGKTEIQFTIPLNSGDANNIILAPGGSYYIFGAYSSADDYTTYHDARGYGGQITL